MGARDAVEVIEELGRTNAMVTHRGLTSVAVTPTRGAAAS